MSTANIIDLGAYRERRQVLLRTRSAEASTQPAAVNAFAVAVPMPVLIGWFPYWIFVDVPVAAGHRDA